MLHSGILKIKSVYSSKWHKKFKCTQARVMQNEVCVRSVKDPEDGSHWRINNWSESKNNLKSYCYNIVKECDQSTFEKQLLLRTIDLNTILVMMTQLYTVNKMLLIIIIINDGSLRDKTCFFSMRIPNIIRTRSIIDLSIVILLQAVCLRWPY